MSQGNIFCAGIYPFGFHNIIYFLHTFFNIPTFSIMRVFGVLQAIYIYLMLYILLRKICRSRYIPFFGVFIFTLPHLFSLLANMRYQWAIPQEYAMLFLYPCAYFLIQFFERKKQEIETEKEWRQKKALCMAGTVPYPAQHKKPRFLCHELFHDTGSSFLHNDYSNPALPCRCSGLLPGCPQTEIFLVHSACRYLKLNLRSCTISYRLSARNSTRGIFALGNQCHDSWIIRRKHRRRISRHNTKTE